MKLTLLWILTCWHQAVVVPNGTYQQSIASTTVQYQYFQTESDCMTAATKVAQPFSSKSGDYPLVVYKNAYSCIQVVAPNSNQTGAKR